MSAAHLAGGAGNAALTLFRPSFPTPATCEPVHSHTCDQTMGRRHLPFFRAWAMTSAALLLITLVMYRGQLVWLAMVMERFTASASTCRRASEHEKCAHILPPLPAVSSHPRLGKAMMNQRTLCPWTVPQMALQSGAGDVTCPVSLNIDWLK